MTSLAVRPLVPMTGPSVGADARSLVDQVLDSGQLGQGPMVAALEAEFAAAHDVEHGVAVANGTLALQAALLAVGAGPGTEVVTSPVSSVATVNAVLAVGARVRFADIGDDVLMRTDAAAALVNDRTRALLPVHLFGLPADLLGLSALAAVRGLAVVADAAQAHGAAVDGQSVGAWGDASCFSFGGSASIAAGGGGMVLTRDADVADRVRQLRDQGQRRHDDAAWGSNWRTSDLHAAIALPQVRRLTGIALRRRENACRLSQALAIVDGLILPRTPAGRSSAWHRYAVRVTSPLGRDALQAELARHGVDSAVPHPVVLPDLPHLRAHPLVARDDVPNARRLSSRLLCLPVGHHLGPVQVDRVAAALRAVLPVTPAGVPATC